jgi:hypothetical protein
MVAGSHPQPATLDDLMALAARIEVGMNGAGGSSVAAMDDGEPMYTQAQLNAVATAAAKAALAGRQKHETRQQRGQNKGGKMDYASTFGITDDEVRRRFDEGLCICCGVKGHRWSDRDVPDACRAKSAAARQGKRLN